MSQTQHQILIQKKWNQRLLARIVLGVILLCAIYVVILFSVIATFVPKSGPADVMIVLGSKVDGDRPGPTLQKRIDAAIEQYRVRTAPYVIVSGGQGSKENITEAQAMKIALVSEGVPEKSIFIEDKATSTYENLIFSEQIMKEHDWHKALIVTSDFHQYRTHLIADSMGLDFNGVGSDTSDGLINHAYYILREVAGVTLWWLGIEQTSLPSGI